MPPLPSAGQCLRLALRGTFDGRPWNNILHARYAGTVPDATALNTAATAIGSLWNVNFAPLAPTIVALAEINLVDLTSPTSAFGTFPVPHAGTRAGSAFTTQVACCGSWVANLRFRGGHFRSYFPFGVQADALNSFTWSPTFTAEVADAMTGFRQGINALNVGGAPLTLIGLSYFSGHIQRPTPLPAPIVSNVCGPRIDTQRRRLGREVR